MGRDSTLGADRLTSLQEDLAQRYELLEEAGVGGMAVVFRVRDLKHDRIVALKVLRPELVTADGAPRFLREVQIAARLQHPGIVPLYDSGEAAGLPYYVMPFVEGATLRDRLYADGPLPLDEALRIAEEIGEALDHAHTEGLVHRDIKPENILLLGGHAMLADFGLATGLRSEDAQRLTSQGTVLGTPLYMSPEQAAGRDADARSDLYSLACVYYEMLAGHPPFTGGSAQAILARHISDAVPPIRTVRPALPRQLETVLTRALAKLPADRYPTGRALISALRNPRIPIRGRLRAVAALLIVAALAAITWSLLGDGVGVAAPRSYSSRPMTSTHRWVSNPHWSLEAAALAYVGGTRGGTGIFTQPLAGGEASLCVDLPGDEISPCWSPDGKTLAFVSSGEPGTWVRLIDARGGESRKLVATGIAPLDIDRMFYALGDRPWSADGKSLLVTCRGGNGQFAIHRVDRDSGDSEQLSFPTPGHDDYSATYSPDGASIAFSRRSHGRGTLMLMPATGGDTQLVLEDSADNCSPSWTSDGERLVFQTDAESAFVNLWEIDLRSGALTQLTSGTQALYGFSLSTDDRIAYAPFWHDTFLYVVDLETGERRQITDHTADNFGARYSPDGRTLAYHSTRLGDCDVYLHSLSGGQPEFNLTDDPSFDAFPDWSADGERLLFISDRDGAPKIYTVDRNRGNLRLLVDQIISLRIPHFVNGALAARWSPSGESIGYLVDGELGAALWTIAPDGTGARERLPNVRGFDWYLDDERVVVTRNHEGHDELVAVNLETGGAQRLWAGPHSELDVAPDGSAALFCSGPGHIGMGLAVLQLSPGDDPHGLPSAGGESTFVVPAGDGWHVHHGGWAPDSRSIAYTRDEDYGDIFELVERR